METESPKYRPQDRPGRSQRRVVGAVVLVGIGLLMLLWNLGVLSPGDLGQFFGSMGARLGTFFGGLGARLGEFFGSLGRAAADLWPLVLIIAGALLLFRRSPAREKSTRNDV